MDDIKRQRIKKINKITDNVIENFNSAFNQKHLDKLYERKTELLEKIKDTSRSELNRTISLTQLSDIDASIAELLAKINTIRNINLDVDDSSAKKFIEDNPDWILDEEFDYD